MTDSKPPGRLTVDAVGKAQQGLRDLKAFFFLE
jgi:hypothetical protein